MLGQYSKKTEYDLVGETEQDFILDEQDSSCPLAGFFLTAGVMGNA